MKRKKQPQNKEKNRIFRMVLVSCSKLSLIAWDHIVYTFVRLYVASFFLPNTELDYSIQIDRKVYIFIRKWEWTKWMFETTTYKEQTKTAEKCRKNQFSIALIIIDLINLTLAHPSFIHSLIIVNVNNYFKLWANILNTIINNRNGWNFFWNWISMLMEWYDPLIKLHCMVWKKRSKSGDWKKKNSGKQKGSRRGGRRHNSGATKYDTTSGQYGIKNKKIIIKKKGITIFANTLPLQTTNFISNK